MMKPIITIEDLPEPIIEYILSYLSPYRDLKHCMQVNKTWYRYVYAVVRKTQRDFFNAVHHMSVQWSHLEAEPGPTITKRYSHSACCSENSMFIFGGCTTANTTFNDLWRFELGSRLWVRPLATGTYPPPKACATLVSHSENLVLFGGWTHTAPYPLHQVWRVFNQIHVYNTKTNRWTQITTQTTCPPMAGHSATVHGDLMVVFGGIQKQVCDGPFVSSSDVWTLDLESYKWKKQNTCTDAPPPRYGHSQIPIDKHHLIIMGGCGGANMLYNDIWLLTMNDGPDGLWDWRQLEVGSKENAAPHLAFHPACKVGNQVVVMSKSHRSRSSASLPKLLRAPSRIWVPPRMDEENGINMRNAKRPVSEIEPCVNGKRGVLKRPSERLNSLKTAQVSSSDDEDPQDTTRKSTNNVSFSSIPLPIKVVNNSNSSSNSPSTSGYHPAGASNNSSSSSSSTTSPKSPNNDSSDSRGNASAGVPSPSSPDEGRRQISGPNSNLHTRRNRQRQLEGLDRMEQRLRELRAGNLSYPAAQIPQIFLKHKSTRTTKRPMCLYVLDINTALEGYVTWRAVKNQSPSAPEEIILYSLVLGKGEVIMFGGIQKDLSSDQDGDTVPEIVSNSLHFMTAEHVVI